MTNFVMRQDDGGAFRIEMHLPCRFFLKVKRGGGFESGFNGHAVLHAGTEVALEIEGILLWDDVEIGHRRLDADQFKVRRIRVDGVIGCYSNERANQGLV